MFIQVFQLGPCEWGLFSGGVLKAVTIHHRINLGSLLKSPRPINQILKSYLIKNLGLPANMPIKTQVAHSSSSWSSKLLFLLSFEEAALIKMVNAIICACIICYFFSICYFIFFNFSVNNKKKKKRKSFAYRILDWGGLLDWIFRWFYSMVLFSCRENLTDD